MPKILLNDIAYEYLIEYKKIKRIYIRFKNGAFKVTAPFFTSFNVVERMFKDNQNKLTVMVSNFILNNPDLSVGSKITLIGKKYLIEYGTKPMIIDSVIYLDPQDLENSFFKLVSQILFNYAYTRIKHFHQQIYQNLDYPSLIIKKVDSKLGHYHSNKHQIMLNLNLVYNKEELIDYVIVHELVHIQEFNHQVGFYRLLSQILPNYKLLEKQLKGLGTLE